MTESEYESDVSSLNDENLYTSDLDFMSSDYIESDVEGYIPPPTRTKKALTKRLVKYTSEPHDDTMMINQKDVQRESLLNYFQELLYNRYCIKAFNRLERVKEMGLCDPNQEAFLLEKMEMVDKHLNQPFYFEPDEPETYKKLLGKRKRAVRNKYEMYALDPKYRERYEASVRCRVKGLDSLELPKLWEAIEAFDAHLEADTFDGSDWEPDQTTINSEDEVSSFYDEQIPVSELEYFSSDFEDDLPGFSLGPVSRTLAKYKHYMTKQAPSIEDNPQKREAKEIKRAEIDAQFKNFVEKRRALKALGRLNSVKEKQLGCPKKEARELLEFEVVDKKLNNNYYYDPDEPVVYKDLLQKRRKALVKKYQKYAADPDYRDEIRHNTFVNVLRIQPCPIFDQDSESISSNSTFNGSDVPTSEEDFMSDEEVCVPSIYEKPISHSKKALYNDLEAFETNIMHDTESVIEFKRKMRLEAIKRFKNLMIYRRRQRAARRLKTVQKLGAKDPAIMAEKMMNLELSDKKLNKPYYYSPGEPDEFKILKGKRVRAVERKYEQFVFDDNFRDRMLNKIRREAGLRLE